MDPERIINSFMEYSKTFELFWFIFIKKKKKGCLHVFLHVSYQGMATCPFFNMQQKQLSNTNASVPFMCTFFILAWQQEGVTIDMLTDC